MMMNDDNLFATNGKDCHRCLDLVLKIRRGELTGVVLSCHPLDEIVDIDLAKYVESRKVGSN
jgi:hypothetical protein